MLRMACITLFSLNYNTLIFINICVKGIHYITDIAFLTFICTKNQLQLTFYLISELVVKTCNDLPTS